MMFKKVLKDEEGLTLVELLAVVVIMSIIAGIAAVSISKVIQRTREDAAVSNVQQLMSAANLYDIQEEGGIGDSSNATTAKELKDKGTIKSLSFLEEGVDETVTFDKTDNDGEITIHLPSNVIKAGNKGNQQIDKTESEVASLTRDDLFGSTSAGN